MKLSRGSFCYGTIVPHACAHASPQAAAIRDHLRTAPVIGQKEGGARLVQDDPEEGGGAPYEWSNGCALKYGYALHRSEVEISYARGTSLMTPSSF